MIKDLSEQIRRVKEIIKREQTTENILTKYKIANEIKRSSKYASRILKHTGIELMPAKRQREDAAIKFMMQGYLKTRDLAEKIGISEETIRCIKRKLKIPTDHKIKKIRKAILNHSQKIGRRNPESLRAELISTKMLAEKTWATETEVKSALKYAGIELMPYDEQRSDRILKAYMEGYDTTNELRKTTGIGIKTVQKARKKHSLYPTKIPKRRKRWEKHKKSIKKTSPHPNQRIDELMKTGRYSETEIGKIIGMTRAGVSYYLIRSEKISEFHENRRRYAERRKKLEEKAKERTNCQGEIIKTALIPLLARQYPDDYARRIADRNARSTNSKVPYDKVYTLFSELRKSEQNTEKITVKQLSEISGICPQTTYSILKRHYPEYKKLLVRKRKQIPKS
jgi:predicted transcriptional regulator